MDTQHIFKPDKIPSFAEKKQLIHEQFTRYILGEDSVDNAASKSNKNAFGYVTKWMRT